MNQILIGKGIGDIRFGMTRDEVKTVLGEPDEIEQFSASEEEGDNTEAYHYDELEISVSFDEIDDWRLGSIAVSSEDVEFEGMKLIGVSDNELEAKLSTVDMGEVERDDISTKEIPDNEVISYPQASINFWLENGQLSEIQYGPLWDEDEEEPVWP